MPATDGRSSPGSSTYRPARLARARVVRLDLALLDVDAPDQRHATVLVRRQLRVAVIP